MANEYFPKSKEIVNNYLQNVVFIDDEANYQGNEPDDHQLNSLEITKSFAKSQKICAVYNPVEENDLEDLITIAKKADVVVLDWKMDLQNEIVGGEEEDVEEDDPRGKYTIKVIKSILTDEDTGRDSLRLIIVYTGETDLWGITNDIHKALEGNDHLVKEDFSIKTNNFWILVIGKPTLKAKHIPEIEDRIVDWNELPDFILEQFTKMTYGLLSHTVLKSITAIRQKAFRLITVFSPMLDAAFLGHKSLLPNPEDAEEQILDMIGSEVKSILKSYEHGHYLSNGLVKDYIEENIEDKSFDFLIENLDAIPSLAESIPKNVDRSLLAKFVEVGIEKIFVKKDTPSSESRAFSSQCHKIITPLYAKDAEDANESNRQFAILTSIKTNYSPKIAPLLSLGTIARKADDTYWLCIQPKCDAVRIEKNRDFLFASLKKVDDPETRFDFLIKKDGHYLFFRINYSIYQTRFFKFSKTGATGVVKGIFENGKVLFNKGETIMEWIGELRNDFSQSVANKFASEIARVGMDHSEWLRRWSTF